MATAQTPAQIANRPLVSIAAWPNTDRRTTVNPRTEQVYNDSHMNVKVQLNALKLASIIAEALGKGETSVEILGGLWTNDDLSDDKPCITGNANSTRAMIEARKLAKAQDEAKAALTLAAQHTPPADLPNAASA